MDKDERMDELMHNALFKSWEGASVYDVNREAPKPINEVVEQNSELILDDTFEQVYSDDSETLEEEFRSFLQQSKNDESWGRLQFNRRDFDGRQLLRDQVAQVLEGLDKFHPKAKEIVTLRYGLEDGVNKSFDEIAAFLNMEADVVEVIHDEGLSYMQRSAPIIALDEM